MKALLSSMVLLAALAGQSMGQCSSTLITASDPSASDFFGTSAAMGPNELFIGAPYDDNARGTDAGSVYWYMRSGGTWQNMSRFNATENGAIGFGRAVSTDGQTLVVGGMGGGYVGVRSRGSAWIMQKGLWGLWYPVGGVLNPNLAAGDDFGASVAVDGNLMVIGAPGLDYKPPQFNLMQDIGAAFIYTKDQGGAWNYTEILVNPTNDSAAGDYFGSSVAVSGDTIVVGAPHNTRASNYTSVNETGSVMIFSPGGGAYTYDDRLFGWNSTQAQRHFGASVSIDGDWIMVGSPGLDFNGYHRVGMVEFFKRNNNGHHGWTETLTYPSYEQQDDVALGTQVVIKYPWAMATAPGTGKVYLFHFDGDDAVLQGMLPAANFAGTSAFGSALAINGDDAVIADRYGTVNGMQWAGYAHDVPLLESAGSDIPGYGNPITLPGSYEGCTQFATPTLNLSGMCGYSDASPDVWYIFNAPMNGPVVFDTVGSGFDTVLAAYGSSGWITCNDDGFINDSTHASKITFDATAGEVYYIRVAGYEGKTGSYILNGKYDCPADFNDDGFVDFFDFNDFVTCFEGGTCPPGKSPDFNNDGFPDFFDFNDFVAAFQNGC